jgi:hypothetical protein
MSERIRLTIAVAMTILLLLAVSAAGLALHTGPSTATVRGPIALTTQAAHPTSTPYWHEEHD